MADLIIKGMEMPKGCFYCPIGVEHNFTGSIRCPLLGKAVGYFDEVKNKRDMNCPLLPLPEKHGRLGDLDKLEESLRMAAAYQTGERQQGMLGCCETIRMAKPIIPAEGGGEE